MLWRFLLALQQAWGSQASPAVVRPRGGLLLQSSPHADVSAWLSLVSPANTPAQVSAATTLTVIFNRCIPSPPSVVRV